MNTIFKRLLVGAAVMVGMSACEVYVDDGYYYDPYYDTYCYDSYYGYYDCGSSYGDGYYDEYGYWHYYLSSSTGGRSRDIVADVATREAARVKKAADGLVSRYQLDSKKAVQVARLLNDWNKLKGDRAKTEADLAAFSEKLYGVKYTELKKAVTEASKGNKAALHEAVANAAANWGTSEESMKEVLNNWYGDKFKSLY